MTFDLLPHSFFTLRSGDRLRYAQFEPKTPSRGTILIVPGRREFIEKKFTELGQNLLDQGFRLIIVEPRGQGLSSRFLSGNERQRDHIDDFSVHLDDLRAFFAEVVKPALMGPLIVHGHSLGGHLLLRWLAEDQPPVTGAFMSSPMLALAGMPAHLAAYGISWASVRLLNHETRYAPAQHDYNAEDIVFNKNPLTQDEERFKIIEHFFTAHPDLIVGGVTWGWLLSALRSMQATHAWHYLTRVDIPVLALVGSEDQVTPANEISRYLNLIPRVRTHIIPNARHDLLNEIEAARSEAWQRIDAFLKILTLSP